MSSCRGAVDTEPMPTASEFRHVARVLDDARLELDALAERLRRLTDDLVLTGPVRTAVDATIGVSTANIRAATADLDQQATEARRRAAVCDAYTEAYGRFLRSDHPDRTPPVRPARWVRHG